MSNSKAIKRMSYITAAVIALSLIVAVLMPLTVAGTAYAGGISVEADGATVAGEYGGVAASDLWYYKDDALNLEAVKSAFYAWRNDKKIDLGKVDPVVIAIIDTGIFADHEIFAADKASGIESVLVRNDAGQVMGYNAVAKNGNITDDHSNEQTGSFHGTGVASVAAMLIKEMGLESYIKIYPIKANKSAKGDFDAEDVAEAVRHASEDIKADVINLSLGIHENDKNGATWINNAALKGAIAGASNTSVIVTAAGNENNDENNMFYPAAYDWTVSVMSSGKDGKKYGTSNYGAYDLIAPGEEIRVAGGAGNKEYKTISGTSVAAPFVSTAAALLKFMFDAEWANGVSVLDKQPTANAIARILTTQDNGYIQYKDYKLQKLDIAKLLEKEYTSDDVFNYETPVAIRIYENANITTDKDGKKTVKTSYASAPTITFEAALMVGTQGNPVEKPGSIDPDAYSRVEWYVVKGDKERLVGTGKTINYRADTGGEFVLEARHYYENGELMQYVDEIYFEVEYAPFIASDVKVTLTGDSRKSAADAIGAMTSYNDKTVEFSLTGIEYIDLSEPITWYVNGEYAGEGVIFAFSPKEVGNYVISAKYGEGDDAQSVAYENSFRLEVKHFMLQPGAVAGWSLGIILIIGAAVYLLTVAHIKNEKRRPGRIDMQNYNK